MLCVATDDALRWARRCALRAGAAELAVEDARHDDGLAARAARLRELDPDALLLVGERASARALVDVVEAARAASRGGERKPRVVTAGDDALQAEVQHAAAGELALIRALPPDRDEGASAVERLRELRGRPPALAELESRARALAEADVLVCALERAAIYVAFGSGEAVTAMELPAHGMGGGADAVARAVGADSLRRWLTFPLDQASLLDRMANAARRGWTDDPQAVALRLALAREALALAISRARALFAAPALRRPRTIALWGSLLTAAPLAGAVAAVLDGLQPSGAFRLLADGEPLALVVAHAPGRSFTVSLTDDDGMHESQIKADVIARLGTSGRVTVRVPNTRLAAGGIAGPLGVVIDARPRPLLLPERDGERLPLVASWSRALGLAT